MTHHQGQWKSSDFGKSIFPDFFTYARQGPEMDEFASVIDPPWNEVVPTTYIIDRNGEVVRRMLSLSV